MKRKKINNKINGKKKILLILTLLVIDNKNINISGYAMPKNLKIFLPVIFGPAAYPIPIINKIRINKKKKISFLKKKILNSIFRKNIVMINGNNTKVGNNKNLIKSIIS